MIPAPRLPLGCGRSLPCMMMPGERLVFDMIMRIVPSSSRILMRLTSISSHAALAGGASAPALVATATAQAAVSTPESSMRRRRIFMAFLTWQVAGRQEGTDRAEIGRGAGRESGWQSIKYAGVTDE